MLIYIEDLDKAEVLVALYNAVPSPSWMTTFSRRQESQYELANNFLGNCKIKNQYFVNAIDLGYGLKSIKINFRGPEINVSAYREHLRFFGSSWAGTIQEIIDDLREKSQHPYQIKRGFE